MLCIRSLKHDNVCVVIFQCYGTTTSYESFSVYNSTSLIKSTVRVIKVVRWNFHIETLKMPHPGRSFNQVAIG